MRGFCSVSRGLGQADPIGKLPGKIRDEKLGVLVTNQDNTMNSSEDSLQSLSSTNALGESLGRGLVSFTNTAGAEAGLDGERQLAAQYLTLIPWCRLLCLAVGVHP